jgi:hypothetical protein
MATMPQAPAALGCSTSSASRSDVGRGRAAGARDRPHSQWCASGEVGAREGEQMEHQAWESRQWPSGVQPASPFRSSDLQSSAFFPRGPPSRDAAGQQPDCCSHAVEAGGAR